jgi:hypothetical protein
VVQTPHRHKHSSCGWVCSLVEHWLLGFFSDRFRSLVLPAWRVQENHPRAAGRRPDTLLGPEETGLETPDVWGFSLVSSGFWPRCRVDGVARAAGLFLPPYRIGGSPGLRGVVGVGGGVGWCPFVF